MSDLEAVGRVVAAAVLGAAIGLERESRAQSAGMRTNALVAAGAALFTLAGAYGFADVERSSNVDPMRVAAQVVAGLGFVGAGAIIREGASVRGLTTAAALWASGAVGLAVGAGYYTVAVAGILVVLVVLVALRHVRPLLVGVLPSLEVVTLEYEPGHGTLGPLVRGVSSVGGTLENLDVDDAEGLRTVRAVVRTREHEALVALMEELRALPEVRMAGVGIDAGGRAAVG
jgi:putative Mg2+ transporter-C (MgtC) family protein